MVKHFNLIHFECGQKNDFFFTTCVNRKVFSLFLQDKTKQDMGNIDFTLRINVNYWGPF